MFQILILNEGKPFAIKNRLLLTNHLSLPDFPYYTTNYQATYCMFRRLTLLLFALFSFFNNASAQVSVTATGGTLGPTSYTDFTTAFTAINNGTHTGAI